MGLDTTHDCWHGPYSMFHEWRCALHRVISSRAGGDASCETLEEAWKSGRYADQTVPLNVLMAHSDCEGEIPAATCGPLADALQALVDSLPTRGTYDVARPAAERFIAGLRKAAALGEPVGFH